MDPPMPPPPPPPRIDPDSDYARASNAGRIVGVVAVFHFIAFTFVALRTYVRAFMVKSFGLDDCFIVISVLIALGSWICLCLQVPYGLGRHGLVIPPEQRVHFEHISFWKTVMTDGFAMGFLRISMALSLMRLNREIRWYKYSLHAIIVFVVLYTIQATVVLFTYCKPYSGWWEFQWMNPFDPRCFDFNLFLNLTYWNISCNIFTDICLGVLPIPVVWNLKMKLRLRLYVIAILNLGYFSIAAGVCKAIFMLTTGGSPDNTFDYWVHFWQNLQLNIGIIAACAQFLRPLLGRVLKLNSTAVKSYPQYPNQEGRGKYGLQTIGSSATKRRTRLGSLNVDEFELQTKNLEDRDSGVGVESPSVANSPATTAVPRRAVETSTGPQQRRGYPGGGGGGGGDTHSAAAALYSERMASTPDSNSEEYILHHSDKEMEGIVCRKDYTVEYSER
ncbi:Integral membrane protein [Apiospora saccharicola]|uniref:Integral membrane protein n=1 Tax=Apiospora saccharicola TaxID=335842 RepID=A0ABR1V8L4_9PEZI